MDLTVDETGECVAALRAYRWILLHPDQIPDFEERRRRVAEIERLDRSITGDENSLRFVVTDKGYVWTASAFFRPSKRQLVCFHALHTILHEANTHRASSWSLARLKVPGDTPRKKRDNFWNTWVKRNVLKTLRAKNCADLATAIEQRIVARNTGCVECVDGPRITTTL